MYTEIRKSVKKQKEYKVRQLAEAVWQSLFLLKSPENCCLQVAAKIAKEL